MTIEVKLDMDALREAHANATRKGAGFWRPENGPNRVRFLPGWPGASVPFVTLHQHFLGGDENKVYTCPSTPGIDRPCSICKESKRLLKGGEAEQQRGNELKYNRANLWNVLVRGKEGEGVQIHKTAWSVHQALLGYSVDEVNVPAFLDPFKGYDVIVDKSGSGLMTKYDVRLIPRPCSLAGSAEEIERLWMSAPDLGKYLKAPSDADLRAALRRMDGIDEDEGAFPVASPVGGRTTVDAVSPVVSPRSVSEAPLPVVEVPEGRHPHGEEARSYGMVESAVAEPPQVVQVVSSPNVVAASVAPSAPTLVTSPGRSSVADLQRRLAAQLAEGK